MHIHNSYRLITKTGFVIFLLIYFHSCESRGKSYPIKDLEIDSSYITKNSNNDTNYCSIIDSILLEYNYGASNKYLISHLRILIKKTGISSHAHNGFAGTYYDSASIFLSDMEKFRKALGCGTR